MRRGAAPFAAAWLAMAGALWAVEAPQFTSVQTLAGGEFRVQLTAPAGGMFRIETSTDLAQWSGFLTFASTGALAHDDSAAPFAVKRFYRARELGGTNIVTGDHLVTTNGDVIIHPVAHASLALRWNNKTIFIDPATNAFTGVPRADLILFTHTHGDHFSAGATAGLTNTGAAIVAPQGVYSSLSAALQGITTVLTNGMSTSKLGLNITALPAYNLAGSPHAKGPNNGYLIAAGGKRLYFGGDTEDTPEMRALTGVDVAFLAMNTPYTMTVTQAVSAVRAFRPAVVYPCHYRNQDGSFADLNAFKQQVKADPGIEVRLRPWY